MLLQLIYTVLGKNLVLLLVFLSIFASIYLTFIFKAGVRVGIFGNLISCLAGIVSPLTAALAEISGIFKLMFILRFPIETALVILAAAGMLKNGEKRSLGMVIILGNYLFFNLTGCMIPLGMQDPGYWLKTALAVGAFGAFMLYSTSNNITTSPSGSCVIIPVIGPLVRSLDGNDYANDGFTAYDRGNGRSFHYSMGEWYDQNGNMIPSASAHAWGLDDYYDKYIAGHDLIGRNPFDSK